MKNKKRLIQLLVVLALLGFIACSVYMFYIAFDILVKGKLPEEYLKEMNTSLIYITSGLTGLVGGIVATSFGVQQTENPNRNASPSAMKFQSLGTVLVSSNESDEMREKIGYFYALAYILVGMASVIIWVVLNENTIQSVSNMATTFFGMLIPIVAQFFNRVD